MALDPHFTVYRYDEYTKYLQPEAISDIMSITPREKHTGLGSYGLSPACRAVVWAVLRGMKDPLSKWAAKENIIIPDLHKPLFQPEAFRLEPGSGLWPSPGRVVVLMPLSTGRASVEVMPRGTNYCIPTRWAPGLVLFLNETGIRFTGNGCLRFIYIMLHKSPLPQKTKETKKAKETKTKETKETKMMKMMKKYRFRYYNA
ncbi:hypothetical protein NCS55_00435800 [Fusarium keratoplasticum]|nr:hypothetical protein NCS55_00435800 [Fusarium keratoplasticum]